MYAAPGVGLAAPQVRRLETSLRDGLLRRKDPAAAHRYDNPEVLASKAEQNGEEGVCRFRIFFPVQREFRASSRPRCDGNLFEVDGWTTARCMLHETDHCDGIVFNRQDHDAQARDGQAQDQEVAEGRSW